MASKEMVSDGSRAGLFVCQNIKNQTKQLFQQPCGCKKKLKTRQNGFPNNAVVVAIPNTQMWGTGTNSALLPRDLAVALIQGGAGIQIPFGRGLVTSRKIHPCPDPSSFPSPQPCSPTTKAPRTRR